MAYSQNGDYMPDPTGDGYSTQTQAQQAPPALAPDQTIAATAGQQVAPGQNPLQPAYLPTPPQALATTYNAQTYDPSMTGATGYNAATYQNGYNPQTATDELNNAAGVQNKQQNQNLLSMLAAQGISPGSSAAQAAAQNLGASQTAALAPALAQAQEYGAGLDEQSGLANAGALNTSGQFNAGAQNAAGQFNAGANNTAGQFNAGSINSAGSQNASAGNTMTLQNLQNLLQSQEFNDSAYNNAGSQAAGYENQDWLAQLQAQLGLQQTGLNTSGNLAGNQANQQVPLNPSLFSQISQGVSAVAPAFAGA